VRRFPGPTPPIMPTPKVAFVYHNARRRLAEQAARGDEPDSTLLGQNHLGELGIEAWIHDARLTRAKPSGREPSRLLWHLREMTLPWELGGADLVVTPMANVFPLALRLRRRPRLVLVNYGLCTIYDRASAARRRLIRSMVRSAAAVVSLAEWQRERLIEQTGMRPGRSHTIPLGIDSGYFTPLSGSEPQSRFVLAVGKDPARDYATLAEAVSGLDARVELAAYPRNLEGVRLPPNASARVVGSAELRELYARASCVVLPQRRQDYPYGSEGGGLTALLEAMAMGRAVVATDRPAIREYALDGETAVLVPPEDPAALREGLERVLGDPGLGAAYGEAARERVEREFTTRRFAERLAPLLRDLT
jgi:glycosyltransferase involved in cell wall biosynthesis